MDFCSLSRSKLFLRRNCFPFCTHTHRIRVTLYQSIWRWHKRQSSRTTCGADVYKFGTALFFITNFLYTKYLRTLHFKTFFFLVSRGINRKNLSEKVIGEKKNNKRNIYSRRPFTFILKQRYSFYCLFIFHRLCFLR
jgi:hypothetical protein